MDFDLYLDDAIVVTPAGPAPGSVGVAEGKIAALLAPGTEVSATRTIDCGGRPVLPGLVDPHVHLGGGVSYEELCETESVSAAAGGVTTILQYRRSLTTFAETFPEERRAAAELMPIDTAYHFILGGMEQVQLIPEYAALYGVTTYKFYMGGYPPGNPIGLITVDDATLFRAMEHIRGLGPYARCMVHCEDDSLVIHLTAKARASGREDLPAYTESRPAFVEEQDLLRAIWLAELTGCPLYVPHTTVGMAVEEAANARMRGASVHLETCPHYLALTADDERLAAQGAGVGKVAPALRDQENQDRLWWGLEQGLIHTVGSDHVPIAKTGAALWEERPGFAGLGTMLPVVYTYGVAAERIDLAKLAEVTAANPAHTFGLYPQKGAIAVGSDADLLLIDPDTPQVVGPETTHSRYTSAFEGLALQGWPVFTIRRGEVIFEDGTYLGRPGTGRVVGPQADFDVKL